MAVNKNRPEKEYWFCIIGPAGLNGLPFGMDQPLRDAVENAFREATGQEHTLCSSGWGLTQLDIEELRKCLNQLRHE